MPSVPDFVDKPPCRITFDCEDKEHERQVREWIEWFVQAEVERQTTDAFNEGLDEQLRDSLDWPEGPNLPSRLDHLKPGPIEQTMIDRKQVPSITRAAEERDKANAIDLEAMQAVFTRDRSRNADFYVTSDGAVWDHKPTWRDRLLRRKPHPPTDSGLWKGK